MNTRNNLILANGVNKTPDIQSCNYNKDKGKYEVVFHSGKPYLYNYNSIEWLTKPEVLDPFLVKVSHGERELFKIQDIRVFHARATDYWYIRFADDSERTYDRQDLTVSTSCLGESTSKNCFAYLKKMASMNEIRNSKGEILLDKQYEQLGFVAGDSAMAVYLNPHGHKPGTYIKEDLIFPFGGNASQFKAVKEALNHQISIIQGPPGTGKTQTILNIIANLLSDHKSVLIVSNNNSATGNVLDKLASSKYNMGFLAAPLGNADNKKAFLQNQTGRYPAMSDWQIGCQEQLSLRQKIDRLAAELSETFKKQERLAAVKLELDSLLLELQYFEQYCSETGLDSSAFRRPKRALKSKKLMELWRQCYGFSERGQNLTFWFKIRNAFLYGLWDWSFYRNSLSLIITQLQSLFYEEKKSELENEMNELEHFLKSVDAKGKMNELTDESLCFLRGRLYDRYGGATDRVIFTENDMWKNAGRVVKEYPVVLSTTFSSRSSLKNVIYDYIIMDEASQVDIATGALALSCARNAVIVGDLKQLPNVVKEDMKAQCDVIFASYKLAQGYSFSENSFLKSICSVVPDVPQTLLREHYRCHPKIIGFCNQKFYNGELIVMTEDLEEPDTLSVFKTVEGNHRRDHTNQRQIDVLIQEALPGFKDEPPEQIGIVAPYKAQVKEIASQLGTDKIEVHTVHKFQGREKDVIVLTTVDDVVTDFSDDPYLLNVAVSRAKRRLCLIVSGNGQPADSNIGDLVSYIEYHNFKVTESEIYSVFDLLYQQYTDARIAYLKKHARISAYDSENLMYAAITQMLDSRPGLSLNIICHQPLNMLIREPKHLNEAECRYAMNTATHLDFLIYNRIVKKPVFAIEVDGFHYHKSSTPQYERDRMKDHILSLYGIPLLRFPTTGSGELARIAQMLDEYEQGRLL